MTYPTSYDLEDHEKHLSVSVFESALQKDHNIWRLDVPYSYSSPIDGWKRSTVMGMNA